ncbi:MAG: hypothetical protein M1395_08610 [Bacteroidetes bacterium]|nr:hypothetical protein [Bacteroidota bacterium]
MKEDRGREGYALISVLFLVLLLSALSIIILRVDLYRRRETIESLDKVSAGFASKNGVIAAVEMLDNGIMADSSFTMNFPDSSHAEVKVFQWGLYAGVESEGVCHRMESTTSALLGSTIPSHGSAALVLGNFQHGLTFAGNSKIIGNVVVGPRGVSIAPLRGESSPVRIPIEGRLETVSTKIHLFSASTLEQEVRNALLLLKGAQRSRMAPEGSDAIECVDGQLDLSDLSDTVREVFSQSDMAVSGSIMRRGPPLTIVALKHLSILPNTSIVGAVSFYSSDSVAILPRIQLVSCIIASAKIIYVEDGSSFTAQLFAPVIDCQSNCAANYPSAFVSINLLDSTGIHQSITMLPGSKITGAVVMHVGAGILLQDATIDIQPGATVSGEVFDDGYLTMDGKIDGLVRTFDLYFYDLPTVYLGWLRTGIIDRSSLPEGFLQPIGFLPNQKAAILTWL